ncbi:adenylate/guanylate cyclase domain-containing protein [Sinomonas susongensis]|uniref:adenylate/guanylate cyclase domain-containing protein n=1 Tax=Sinomonas susongensis TaxID=1324851 RepID=UPI0011098693|nr:adenylate/guanylate cyclase domain-containing protein [Sinomonas susongensis]
MDHELPPSVPADVDDAPGPAVPVEAGQEHPDNTDAAPGDAAPSSELARAASDYRRAAKSLENLLLGGERTLKRREVAQGLGLSLFSARKLWRALGMPNFTDDDLAFTTEDLEHLRLMPGLVRDGVLTEDAALSVTRAIGQMTDRMVVWQVEALVEDMVATQGISDAEARVRLVEELPNLIEPLEEMLVYSWRRQLSAGVQRLAVRAKEGLEASEEGRTGREDDAPLPLARAVGFADLVSYTSLSRRMNEKTLARLVQTFENTCAEVISVGGGRLVKTVGDEVLYIAETPTAGAEIALALSREIAADERLPEGRVAMVWGRVLSRLGDIYGPTVNLAARLTAIAAPGQVLVDELTAGVLGSDARFVLSPLAAQNVRGFGEVRPVALSRGEGTGIVLD